MRSLSFLFSTIFLFAQVSLAKNCKSLLNGSNGCYSQSWSKKGECKTGYQFCTKSNCSNNGGEWSGSSCVAKGTGNKIQSVAASIDCGANAEPNPAGSSLSASSPMSADQACKCKYSDQLLSVADADMYCPYDSNSVDNSLKCDSSSGAEFSLNAEAANKDKPCLCPDRKTTVAYNTPCSDTQKTSVDTDIESCLSSLTQKVQACTTSAEKAVTSCGAESTLSKDQQSNNSNIKTGQQVLNAIGQLSIGQKVGSGEVNACVLTTLGTQTAAGLLDTFKEGCASDVSSCVSDCDGIQDLLKNSAAIYAQCGMNIDFNSATSQSMSKRAQIDQKIEELSAAFSSADNNCNTNAKGKKTVLEETAGRSVASAQQAAKVCNCQNVAGATNCNNLPTMAQCKLTPGLSGCAVYQNNCVANPNSPACVCVTDPNGNACKLSLNNNPNLQGMVAALNTLPTTNGNVSTGSPYAMKSVKDLIGSLGDEATKVASATTDTGGPASPFAAAQGGGGMGGGAGGGGGLQQQGEGGAAVEEERKGIGGGFITNAKNFLSDMFGGKKGGNGVGGAGNGFKVKPNPDAWRPKLRIPGSAGDEYALGSKNKNIFDIMTKRYSDQTHTFIQTP